MTPIPQLSCRIHYLFETPVEFLEAVGDRRIPRSMKRPLLALAFEFHARVAAHTHVVVSFVPVMTLRTLGVLRYVIVMRIWIEILGALRHRLKRFMTGEALIGLNRFLRAFRVTAQAFKASGFMPVGGELLLALAYRE
jgi:hypothetical protein